MYLCNLKALRKIFENCFSSLEPNHNYNTRDKSNKNYFVNIVVTNIGKNLLKFKWIEL